MKVVVVDIDGTITKSDAIGIVLPWIGEISSRAGNTPERCRQFDTVLNLKIVACHITNKYSVETPFWTTRGKYFSNFSVSQKP